MHTIGAQARPELARPLPWFPHHRWVPFADHSRDYFRTHGARWPQNKSTGRHRNTLGRGCYADILCPSHDLSCMQPDTQARNSSQV